MSSPSQYRYLLRSKHAEVVDQIVPAELLSHLIQNGVFSLEEAEMVEDTRGGMTARARKLVALVYRKPDDILPVFTQCLRDAHHDHVADLLEGEGFHDVELRLSVRNLEAEKLEEDFSQMYCDDQSIPGPLDELPSPAPFKCPCKHMEDTIRESILVASGEMQKCMIQGKLAEWKSYEATINNCFLWLQESRRMGCDLCQVKTGCVILMFRCRKRGLDFLWEGLTTGRFGREFTAIFRDLYAEMKGIAICIDVAINPAENGGACAYVADEATGTEYSDEAMEITSVEPEADRHDHAFRGHFARRFEERALVDHEEYRYGQRFYGLDQVDRGYDLEYGRERSCTVL